MFLFWHLFLMNNSILFWYDFLNCIRFKLTDAQSINNIRLPYYSKEFMSLCMIDRAKLSINMIHSITICKGERDKQRDGGFLENIFNGNQIKRHKKTYTVDMIV